LTSETYGIGGQEQTSVGGVILGAISFLAAVLVIAGLIYATGTGERHQAALAAASAMTRRICGNHATKRG